MQQYATYELIFNEEKQKQLKKYYNLYIKYFYKVEHLTEEFKKALEKMHKYKNDNETLEGYFNCLNWQELEFLEKLFNYNYYLKEEKKQKIDPFKKSLSDYVKITYNL